MWEQENLIAHFSEVNQGKKNCLLMCQVESRLLFLSRIISDTITVTGLRGGDVRYLT